MPGAIIQVLQARDGVLFFLATVDKTKTKGGAYEYITLIYDKFTIIQANAIHINMVFSKLFDNRLILFPSFFLIV